MSDTPVLLARIRSHHLGGGQAVVQSLPVQTRRMVDNASPRSVDMNGTYAVGQLYVQEYRLHAPRHALPVLLMHGGGMTGAQWEATPDGRDGWLWRFLQAGFDVLVADAPERGRASWAMFPQVYAEPPVFRTQEEAWTLFRIGPRDGYAAAPAARRAYPGQQFPVPAFDAFARQFVPRWPGHDDMALSAYRALLAQFGPCLLVGHSQGGGYAARLARDCPRHVRAVAAIEPTGMPTQAAPTGVPHLLAWGDHFLPEDAVWAGYRRETDRYWAALRQAGDTADTLDLPAAGLPGNSHFCMLDRNSDQVADRLIAWLDAHAPLPRRGEPRC